jgi:hypothetical protein
LIANLPNEEHQAIYKELFQLSLAFRQSEKGYFNYHPETYERINLSLNKAFALPSLNNYSQSLSLRGLLIKSVEMFVGSRGKLKVRKSFPKTWNCLII